jgi:hypothetical protein
LVPPRLGHISGVKEKESTWGEREGDRPNAPIVRHRLWAYTWEDTFHNPPHQFYSGTNQGKSKEQCQAEAKSARDSYYKHESDINDNGYAGQVEAILAPGKLWKFFTQELGANNCGWRPVGLEGEGSVQFNIRYHIMSSGIEKKSILILSLALQLRGVEEMLLLMRLEPFWKDISCEQFMDLRLGQWILGKS